LFISLLLRADSLHELLGECTLLRRRFSTFTTKMVHALRRSRTDERYLRHLKCNPPSQAQSLTRCGPNTNTRCWSKYIIACEVANSLFERTLRIGLHLFALSCFLLSLFHFRYFRFTRLSLLLVISRRRSPRLPRSHFPFHDATSHSLLFAFAIYSRPGVLDELASAVPRCFTAFARFQLRCFCLRSFHSLTS